MVESVQIHSVDVLRHLAQQVCLDDWPRDIVPGYPLRLSKMETTKKLRRPINEGNLKNDDDLKHEEELKNEDYLKNNDILKRKMT